MVRLPEVTEVIRVRLSPADLAVVRQLKAERGVDTSRLVRELIRAAAGPPPVVHEDEEPGDAMVELAAAVGREPPPRPRKVAPAPPAVPPPAATARPPRPEPKRSDYPNGQGGDLRYHAALRVWRNSRPTPGGDW